MKYRGQALKVSKDELEPYMKLHDRFLELTQQGYFKRSDYNYYVKTIVNTHYTVIEQLAKIDLKYFDKEVEKTLGEDDA